MLSKSYSVPLRRRMLNCSGVRIACHSSSDFCTGPGGGVDDDIADTLGNLRPAAPRDRDTAASPLHGCAALERGTRRSARGVAEAEAEEAQRRRRRGAGRSGGVWWAEKRRDFIIGTWEWRGRGSGGAMGWSRSRRG